MRYELLLVDPPWPYDRDFGGDPKNGGIQYSTMTVPEIASLDLSSVCKKDAVCLCWATFPKLKEGILCLESWGFRYVTAIFTWLKINKDGSPRSGLGSHTNSNQEIVLLGKKGKGLKRIRKDIKQPILSPIRKHSQKPDELYRRVEQLYGPIERLEVFARNREPGWNSIGIEISGEDIRIELERIRNGTWVQK